MTAPHLPCLQYACRFDAALSGGPEGKGGGEGRVEEVTDEPLHLDRLYGIVGRPWPATRACLSGTSPKSSAAI